MVGKVFKDKIMERYYQGVASFLGPDGILQQAWKGFEYRREQENLAREIARSYVDETFLISEVGTGVGKTFAYLIPSILWAVQRKEKIVVSTRTKALQQQLVDRDLPDLKNIMDLKFKYAEAKGRDNFLCWNKYINILAGKKILNAVEQELVQQILRWAETTQTGDKKELNLGSELMQQWPVLSADRHSCERDACKYHDKCFRLKMKAKLSKADIIVANHALLLSDVLINQENDPAYRVLPVYSHLVVDEAHSFIKECFDRFSLRFSYYRNMDLLHILHNKDKKTRRGYLTHLQSNYAQMADLLGAARVLAERAEKLTRGYFASLNEVVKYRDDYSFHHVLTPADRNRPWFGNMIDTYLDWQSTLNLLLNQLRDITGELADLEEDSELAAITNSLQEISDTAFQIMEEDLHRDDKIIWLEYDKGRAIAICSADIYAGEKVSSQLYQDLKSLIMVSATLTVEKSFTNFISRSGLEPYSRVDRLATLLEDSPFNYEQQACLYIVRDIPDPSQQCFNQEVNTILEELLMVAQGRTMVLFTSRKQLQDASFYLRPRLSGSNLKLLVQYEDGEFGALMDEFVSRDNGVLMGLETFWEGIDLKGDCLKCLVIVKLPFRSPSDPYSSAWERYYRSRHQNSFEHFMLPDAAVRFKQGVGRLIRSETDRGAIVVLDTRLISKNYGRVILNSIPVKNVKIVDRLELWRQLPNWL